MSVSEESSPPDAQNVCTGLSIKDVCSQGEGFVQCGQGVGGSSDAYIRTFWCEKTPEFSKFMVCPQGQERDLSQCKKGGWGTFKYHMKLREGVCQSSYNFYSG